MADNPVFKVPDQIPPGQAFNAAVTRAESVGTIDLHYRDVVVTVGDHFFPKDVERAFNKTKRDNEIAAAGQALMDAKTGDELDAVLHKTHGSLSQVMSWMYPYAELNTNPRLDNRAATVLAKLEAAGYSAADRELQDVEFQETYGRRAVGIIMQSLVKTGRTPHPSLVNRWVARYDEIEDTPTARITPVAKPVV